MNTTNVKATNLPVNFYIQRISIHPRFWDLTNLHLNHFKSTPKASGWHVNFQRLTNHDKNIQFHPQWQLARTRRCSTHDYDWFDDVLSYWYYFSVDLLLGCDEMSGDQWR